MHGVVGGRGTSKVETIACQVNEKLPVELWDFSALGLPVQREVFLIGSTNLPQCTEKRPTSHQRQTAGKIWPMEDDSHLVARQKCGVWHRG